MRLRNCSTRIFSCGGNLDPDRVRVSFESNDLDFDVDLNPGVDLDLGLDPNLDADPDSNLDSEVDSYLDSGCEPD